MGFLCRELGPNTIDDLGTVTNTELVHVAVETVAVHVRAVGIDRRRRCGVAGNRAAVYRARARPVLMAPDLNAGVSIQSNDVAIVGCDKEQVARPGGCADTTQVYGRAIDSRWKRGGE